MIDGFGLAMLPGRELRTGSQIRRERKTDGEVSGRDIGHIRPKDFLSVTSLNALLWAGIANAGHPFAVTHRYGDSIHRLESVKQDLDASTMTKRHPPPPTCAWRVERKYSTIVSMAFATAATSTVTTGDIDRSDETCCFFNGLTYTLTPDSRLQSFTQYETHPKQLASDQAERTMSINNGLAVRLQIRH